MNTELIITLLIVFFAVFYALYRSIKYFKRLKQKRNTPDDCKGCDSDCDGCPFFKKD